MGGTNGCCPIKNSGGVIMCDLEPREHAEYIFKLIKPGLRKLTNPEWSSERYDTAWGTKSPEGMVESITRAIGTKVECLPRIEN